MEPESKSEPEPASPTTSTPTPTPMTTTEVLTCADEVLRHVTRSYVRAAADLSVYLLHLVVRRDALIERLRGRADSCRRTAHAHLENRDSSVAMESFARAQAYELAMADVMEALR